MTGMKPNSQVPKGGLLSQADLQFYMPFVKEGQLSRVAILGDITWLWMNSELHASWPVLVLERNVLPAIDRRQFLMMRHRNGMPLAYVSWAWLDEAREKQYLRDPLSLSIEDWSSGDRMWLMDWIAPFGGSTHIASVLRQRLFPHEAAWALRVKKGSTKGRVHVHFGSLTSPDMRRSLGNRLAHELGAKKFC